MHRWEEASYATNTCLIYFCPRQLIVIVGPGEPLTILQHGYDDAYIVFQVIRWIDHLDNPKTLGMKY